MATKRNPAQFPQLCRSVNVHKRNDIQAGVAYLSLGITVPLEWYRQVERDPALLVEVRAVTAIDKEKERRS